MNYILSLGLWCTHNYVWAYYAKMYIDYIIAWVWSRFTMYLCITTTKQYSWQLLLICVWYIQYCTNQSESVSKEEWLVNLSVPVLWKSELLKNNETSQWIPKISSADWAKHVTLYPSVYFLFEFHSHCFGNKTRMDWRRILW